MPGCRRHFLTMFSSRDRQHAGLRRHDDGVVLGDEIARRPQTVAVERRADLPAVGESHRRRTVPRLHQTGVIFVEGATLRIHRRIAGPGFRDKHHRRVGEAVAAHRQKFESVVEAGGVGLAFIRNRPELRDVAAEQRRRDGRLPRRHPVDVAPQRIDLAVVRDHPIRVRELPRRERVGREALVHERQGRRQTRIGKIPVVGLHLVRQEHALVDERSRRQRHRVVADVATLVGIVDGVRDDLADDIESAARIHPGSKSMPGRR